MAGRRMPVVKDRRSSLRVEVDGRARIHTDRDEFEGRCIDLGLGGLAIQSTRAARPGALVTVEARIEGQRLRIDAELVRRRRVKGEYLLGLAFVDLDLDTQRRIEHLMFERLAGSPQAGFMRAFVAHADRVPPAADRTVVAGTLLVPVISGHTQVVAVSQLPTVDRTVIAPPPPRTDTVRADDRPPPTPTPTPGVPDDAWLDDEMDTAQFRLLEAAQAKEAAELELDDEELALLEPDEPVPDHTVVVGGFAVPPPRDRTLVTGDAFERSPRERTLVTGDATEPLARERTLVTGDGSEQPPPERTLVTIDGSEQPPPERTLVTTDSTEPLPRERTLVTTDASERPPRERTLVTTDASERPLAERTIPLITEPLPELPAERTVPFLRDFLGRAPVDAPGPARDASEHTALVSPGLGADASGRPTLRALLDATALLQRPAQRGKRGPRVIVSIPHRTYRRVASTPWNDP